MDIDNSNSGVPGAGSFQSLVDRLQYDEFFRLFPAATRAELFARATHKYFPAGSFIYHRGDEEAFMGIVMAGRLRMSMHASDGRGVLVGLVESGEVFGETTLLDALPRTTDAEAETDVSLMILRRDDFMPALKASPEAMLGVIQMLCHRLRIYLDTIDLIALQNLPKRLARHLLRLAADYGVSENGQTVIRAGLNQASLGQQLATSRESINKQLKSFATEGLIRLNGNEIILLNQQALRDIA
ncbi:MAG: Crp/Fnr family transcriptional regulator [Alphaproteobacteria bacterium]|nr:Crp/Fnr family transcriptional regulator [Alphaproteobacteria bacterium]